MSTRSHPIRSRPSLGDLLDLSRQLGRDGEASGASLRHRDREIGRELADLERRPAAQLLGWLDRIRDQRDDLRGDRVDTVHRLGLIVLAVAGLFAGWGAAAVVFRYDGTHPVNVIHVVAVFVLVQLLMLVFFALGLLPPGVVRWLPGMRTLQESFGLLSPGRLQRWLTRYLPQEYRDTAASLLGKGLAHQRLYGTVDRWVIAQSSQTFAVLFNVGALASALYLVAFSDLAFSWSTTLQLRAADMQRWTDLLSAPWASFFAGARPSPELIETTRYFRLQDGSFPAAVSPAGLGGWWPFLVMCMTVYGLLPRLLTWFAARQRLRSALSRSFRHLPGADDLRARLNSELVETQAVEPEGSGGSGSPATVGDEPAASMFGRRALVIDWAEAADEETGRRWIATAAGAAVAAWLRAGGACSPEHDSAVVAQAAGEDGDLSVMLTVKAWEPPMAEFLDFVRALRSATGPQRSLLVAPLGRDVSGEPAAAAARHLALWRQAVGRVGDPWLKVLHLGDEA